MGRQVAAQAVEEQAGEVEAEAVAVGLAEALVVGLEPYRRAVVGDTEEEGPPWR